MYVKIVVCKWRLPPIFTPRERQILPTGGAAGRRIVVVVLRE